MKNKKQIVHQYYKKNHYQFIVVVGGQAVVVGIVVGACVNVSVVTLTE